MQNWLQMKITFLGGAREVTGSCYLLEGASARFLVDHGMFQGGAEAYDKNHAELPLEAQRIDFVLLTHAHLDHSGLLPRLVAQGFRGPIYCTRATADLLEVMLLDSAYIQEHEAQWQSRRYVPKHRRERGNEALYTVAQAHQCLAQLLPIGYDQSFTPCASIRCVMRDAGHILGSAILELNVSADNATQALVFSGDLGQPGRPIVRDPTPIERADLLLIESTYGNRQHKSMPATLDELALAINHTLKHKKGNVIVPAFAVGRTQELLYMLTVLARDGHIEAPHIFVDSPMATRATGITLRHLDLLDADTRQLLAERKHNPVFMRTRFVETPEDSKTLNKIRAGAVIISASGMCDAGRIKHHLRNNIEREECSILFTGFQAEGTLGRKIVDRAKTVRIFGEELAVRAEVYTLGGLSAHADQQALLAWLGQFRSPPKHTYVVHGEETTAQGFADLIGSTLGWSASAPARGYCTAI